MKEGLMMTDREHKYQEALDNVGENDGGIRLVHAHNLRLQGQRGDSEVKEG